MVGGKRARSTRVPGTAVGMVQHKPEGRDSMQELEEDSKREEVEDSKREVGQDNKLV
jgi:hypothetical protein